VPQTAFRTKLALLYVVAIGTARCEPVSSCIAQDSNIFPRQSEARPQFGVIKVGEPHAYTLLAWIVPGPNDSANEARSGYRFS
jgi:hypothetical protein